jgi:hypothetical protein
MPPTHFCKCDKKRNIVFKDIAKESSDFIDYTDAEKKTSDPVKLSTSKLNDLFH